MKIGARFSLLKNEIDSNKCIECRKCEVNCPIQIKLKNKDIELCLQNVFFVKHVEVYVQKML